MAIFGPKPWGNPFLKMEILRLFDLSVFIAQKGAFCVLEIRKRHFCGLYCLKKKVGKMAIFGLKPWVNPFRKMSIFRLFELLVFIAQKGVFSFQNIVKDIFLAYIAPSPLKRLEKCQFFDFLNFLFLQPREAFFRSRIS